MYVFLPDKGARPGRLGPRCLHALEPFHGLNPHDQSVCRHVMFATMFSEKLWRTTAAHMYYPFHTVWVHSDGLLDNLELQCKNTKCILHCSPLPAQTKIKDPLFSCETCLRNGFTMAVDIGKASSPTKKYGTGSSIPSISAASGMASGLDVSCIHSYKEVFLHTPPSEACPI